MTEGAIGFIVVEKDKIPKIGRNSLCESYRHFLKILLYLCHFNKKYIKMIKISVIYKKIFSPIS